MDNHYLSAVPDPRRNQARAFFSYGLWLRVGFVGFSGFVAGVVSLLERSGSPVNALAMAIAGGALGAWSWHRATVVLDRIGAPADGGAITPTRDAAFGPPATVAGQ